MEQIAHVTLTDREGNPKGNVCIIERNGELCYGVAIKSETDNWKYGRGKKLAKDRAIAALTCNPYYYSLNNYIVRDEMMKNLHELCWKDHRFVTDLFNMEMGVYNKKCGFIDGLSFVELFKELGRD